MPYDSFARQTRINQSKLFSQTTLYTSRLYTTLDISNYNFFIVTSLSYSWLSLLEGTRWLQHMSGLLRAAVTVASAIERDGRPVLVHCSDGWDRTPQIVALAQILLDPYYRTMEVYNNF